MWPYVVFTIGVLVVVGIDLGVATRRRAAPSVRGAAILSAVWIALAVGFGFWIAHWRGTADALSFFAAYLTEDSLSLDNIVVFVAVFAYFGVPVAYQHRVLFWGILGAVVMRGLMVAAGIALLDRFAWITYVFGAFLVYAGIRALRKSGGPSGAGGGMLRLVARFVPVTEECRDASFFQRIDGRLSVTPLFVALIVIELSDVVFATDSLPAVFGVTRDPFIVYTSNMLAVLGLRSLYFLVSGFIPRLRYLRYGLAAILVFVGGKMLLGDVIEIPTWLSLAVIASSIGTAAVTSLVVEARREEDRVRRGRRGGGDDALW
jgi:TerC family integral membrane protein